MLRTSDLDYDLPESAIATMPSEPRDAARLMVVRRGDPAFLEHTTVRELAKYLRTGDELVVNSTRVIPARLEGWRTDTGGHAQGLFLASAGSLRTWVCMLSARRLRAGVVLGLFKADADDDSGVRLRLLEPASGNPGAWVVRVEESTSAAPPDDESNPPAHDRALLERVGRTPLPPYIVSARKRAQQAGSESYDRARYQTVYAKDASDSQPALHGSGSVAAPTAGLHLTPRVLDDVGALGVTRREVVLHVGTGTFKPVETEFVEQHAMHSEWCSMDAGTHEAVLGAKRSGRRVLCVGTTAARTVESYAQRHERGAVREDWLSTDLLITPGYAWRWTDGLLTNFHLPRSTLLAMVGALLGDRGGTSGIARLKTLYATALREGYRFYSYGDAMLILP